MTVSSIARWKRSSGASWPADGLTSAQKRPAGWGRTPPFGGAKSLNVRGFAPGPSSLAVVPEHAPACWHRGAEHVP
jgi:hypothetical protein